MRTTADRLAQSARALDHAANCGPSLEVRVMMRAHHSAAVLLLAILDDPGRADEAAREWDRICRELVRTAAEAGLVDMSPHYAAERQAR